MNQGGFMGGFYRFGEVFFLMAYLNALWVVFTLLGFVIFGWAPSTTAMFAVLRKWMMGESDRPVFSLFRETYRKEFFRANAIGLVFAFVGYMLYVNLLFFQVENQWIHVGVRYMTIAILIICSIMLTYIFPLMVHYEASIYQYLKNSLLVSFFQPLRTFYTLAAALTVYHILFTIPGLIPFLGISLLGFVIMWTTYRTFLRMDHKQQLEHA
ncbi:YesL family protein [Halalkalibacter urbisdiaboli]|uniref:YesL family protein n=1 Tax=Halalkalibacter urbisdiaboli TaxID=1960589 RepID=UPI000B43CE1B|nr:YesL family protein [Halalkalibacter urbisdiaboli]